MAADAKAVEGASKFGSCCESLKEAMAGDDFEPLISVDDGVLYMAVGIVEVDEDDAPGTFDHPMFFCPFCGTKLQSPEDLDAMGKAGTH